MFLPQHAQNENSKKQRNDGDGTSNIGDDTQGLVLLFASLLLPVDTHQHCEAGQVVTDDLHIAAREQLASQTVLTPITATGSDWINVV